MKNKILVIALILINFIAYSQIDSSKDLSGFWGIEFGSSLQQAKEVMKSKAGCEFYTGSNETQLVYSGGQFAGDDIKALMLEFYNNKFYNATVVVTPSTSNILSAYENMVNNLTAKYSKPDKTLENYEYPYTKGDADYENAIRAGKTQIASRWNFKNAKMQIFISKDLSILYTYTQNEVGDIVDKKKTTNKLNDL